MNKNGFTIIELLIVIVIIGITGSAASIGVVKLIEMQKEKDYSRYKYELESMVCTIVDLNNYQDKELTVDNKTIETCKKDNDCLINVDLLKEQGIITIEANNNVKVTWIDGEKKCEIEE